MARTVRDWIDRQAALRPDAVFLIAPEPGLELTFGELQRASRRVARHLAGLGIEPGERVAMLMGNGFQSARVFLGIMYGGFCVTPLNLLAQPSQLAYVADHCDARVIFVAPDQAARLEAALAGVRRPVHVEICDVDSPSIPADRAGDAPADGASAPAEDADALMMYTSGTTGVPKGVVLAQRNVVAGGEFVSVAHALTEADRALGVLPLYHINAQIVTAVAPLVHGGSVVLPHRFSAHEFWELAERYRCTWLNCVPTIISYLLAGPDPRERGIDTSRIRFCRSASAPLPPAQHRAFEEKFGIGVIETMGLTETAAPCFSNPVDPSKRKVGSPGRAVGNEAKVVDAEGRALAPGTAGEIMVRGPNVMKGYYKAPEATAKALEHDGWLHTGDLGYVDDDGFFFVTGRLKELIIKGGENIAPREIDETLLRHPAVLEAAAVGIPDEHYGQEILAGIVLKPDARCSEDDLRAFCERELGRFKTPRVFSFLAELPKGPSGKVQRLKLVTAPQDR
ncbi:MAG: AMP-binding protein [Proteobacteria bacterium]|nr:AMP-binding protein [Pseudomonadota bacterium]